MLYSNTVPYLQFGYPLDGVTTSCIRAIESISKLDYVEQCDCEDLDDYETIPFCTIQTKDMHLSDRGAEKMLAFGACAEALQYVDYENNDIDLTYFKNDEGTHVIYGFIEMNRAIKSLNVWCEGYVSKFDGGRYANRRMYGYTSTTYYGGRFTCKKGGDSYSIHVQDKKFTVEELVEEYNKMKSEDENLDIARITNFGRFSKYQWFTIYKGDIETLKEAIGVKNLVM